MHTELGLPLTYTAKPRKISWVASLRGTCFKTHSSAIEIHSERKGRGKTRVSIPQTLDLDLDLVMRPTTLLQLLPLDILVGNVPGSKLLYRGMKDLSHNKKKFWQISYTANNELPQWNFLCNAKLRLGLKKDEINPKFEIYP